jgi:hypothetical protein
MERYPVSNYSIKESRQDLTAVGIILVYCILFAAIRLFVSSTMETDEAEQFLKAAYSLGNNNQPPLYTMIVRTVFSIFGVNSTLLIGSKYLLIFFFYLTFYLISRNFWDAKRALILSGSLSLFHTYSYDFIRHLTHTVLVTLIASVTCLIYVRLLQGKKGIYYLSLGIFTGLGILSKYNFIFFLAALILASLSCKTGRNAILDRRIFITTMAGLIIILPHIISLIREGFPAVHYALERSKTGEADLGNFLPFLKSYFIPFLPFIITFTLFFYPHLSLKNNKSDGRLLFFRWLAFYGLLIPLILFFALKSRNLNERWLAPVYFLIPIASSSMVGIGAHSKRIYFFGYLCAFIVFLILLSRSLVGFLPDRIGKVERIHIPFKVISLKLAEELRQRDIHDPVIVSDNWYIAANVMAWMPGARFVPLQDLRAGLTRFDGKTKKGVVLYDASMGGGIPAGLKGILPSAIRIKPLEAKYLHSEKHSPYVLGAAIIPVEHLAMPE